MAQDTAVDVKQAVASARAYLTDLFPTQGEIELEEVEELPAEAGWQVTFSYERDVPDPLGIGKLLPQQRGTRVYKVVTVDAAGNPRSVKIR